MLYSYYHILKCVLRHKFNQKNLNLCVVCCVYLKNTSVCGVCVHSQARMYVCWDLM